MRRTWRVATAVVGVGLLGLTACSSSNKNSSPTATSSTVASTTTVRPRPPGPAAVVSAELTGGKGVFLGEGSPPDLAKLGYEQHEFAASGTATSYKAVGPLAGDGRWKFAPDGHAPYKTRVLVREPSDPAKFSGNVVVEWQNVSGGVDANPEWTSTAEEIVRAGDVWVGVSAQRIGVVGGPVLVKVSGVPGAEAAGKGLTGTDPARYGTLSHPGDGFAFDIFTQVGRAVLAGGGLNGLHPQRIIAAGESQSAIALVTYYDGVQPLTKTFDGFLVHSRGAVGLPLVGPGKYADLAGAIGGAPVLFRTDLDAPVMDVQTETDVASILNSYAARQPDGAHFRLWEVPGTAHADTHLLGSAAKYLNCGVPINDGPMHLVVKAALRALTEWITSGTLPVVAPRIDVDVVGGAPTIRRNADGLALGGIRTPPVDVPVEVPSGATGPNPSTICLLLGSAKPLPAARVAQLYPSRAEYLQKFTTAADATIKAGFVLPEDRDALLAFAVPARVAG